MRLLQIQTLLKLDELLEISSLLAKRKCENGNKTATLAAKAFKNILQIDASDLYTLNTLQLIVNKAFNISLVTPKALTQLKQYYY